MSQGAGWGSVVRVEPAGAPRFYDRVLPHSAQRGVTTGGTALTVRLLARLENNSAPCWPPTRASDQATAYVLVPRPRR